MLGAGANRSATTPRCCRSHALAAAARGEPTGVQEYGGFAAGTSQLHTRTFRDPRQGGMVDGKSVRSRHFLSPSQVSCRYSGLPDVQSQQYVNRTERGKGPGATLTGGDLTL